MNFNVATLYIYFLRTIWVPETFIVWWWMAGGVGSSALPWRCLLCLRQQTEIVSEVITNFWWQVYKGFQMFWMRFFYNVVTLRIIDQSTSVLACNSFTISSYYMKTKNLNCIRDCPLNCILVEMVVIWVSKLNLD